MKGQVTPHPFNPPTPLFSLGDLQDEASLLPPSPPPRVPQNFLDTRASQQRGRCHLLRRGASAPPHLREPPQPPGGVRLTPGRLRDEEAPPALGTYRCRSCRKRPAGGWGRKCKPPPPSPAGSSCRGTRRGSSATPSCCPRSASSLLRSRRAAAVPFAGLFYSRFLTARAPPLPACLPPRTAPLSVSLAGLGSAAFAGASLRARRVRGCQRRGDAERCGAALRRGGPVRGVIASIAPSRAPGAPPPPTNGSPALPHRRERPAGRGRGRGFSALYGIVRGAPGARAGGWRLGR